MWLQRLLLAVTAALVVGIDCGVTPEWEKQWAGQVSERRLQATQALPRNSTLSPIRIHVHYGELFPLSTALAGKLKKEVLPNVVAYYANLLSVYPLTQNLVLPIMTCGPQEVPSDHQTIGVPNTDVIIYVSVTYDPVELYVARAGPCAMDGSDSLGSPIAGLIQINAKLYTDEYGDEIAIIRHEVAHILAISSYLFPLYRQSDGSFYASPVVNSTARGHPVSQLVTPRVVAKAQAAFACPSLTGLELENWGSNGTAGSHWEKRVMLNDFMTGHISPNSIYSDITLAAFEDSGWYEVDYNYTDQVTFGKGRGCGFLTGNCVVDGVAQFPDFCDTDSNAMCDNSLTQKGICRVKPSESPLSLEYQYFSDPTLSGNDYMADYCPYTQPYIDGDCTGFSKIPVYLNPRVMETACPTCRCFPGQYDTEYYTFTSALCYNVTCDSASAKVTIGNHTLECPVAGGVVDIVEGFTGSIKCPAYAQICGDRDVCLGGCLGFGQCVSGKCECKAGYSGRNCGIRCDLSCGSCTGTGGNECLSCYENASLVNGTCTCDSLYKPSLTTKKCIQCDETCLTCSGPAHYECLSCPPNASLDSGVCSCDSGYTRSMDLALCFPCHPNCKTCEGRSANSCLTCKGDTALPSGKTVGVCSCGLGLFMQVDGSCSYCHPSCKLCSGSEATMCLACYPGSSLQEGACTCTGYFDISGKCAMCSPNCLACLDSPTSCTQCDLSVSELNQKACKCLATAFRADSGACVACHSSCKTCKGASLVSCTSCYPNSALFFSPGACLCTAGFYLDPASDQCISCDPQCSKCIGPGSSACTQCKAPAVLSPYLSCMCPKGYFPNPSASRCGKCHSNCQSCVGAGDDQCTSCFGPALLSGQAPSSCICAYGTVPLPTVATCGQASCHATCQTCISSGASNCLVCWMNATAVGNSTFPSSCKCLDGFYPDPTSANCSPCSMYCHTCDGPTEFNCLTCRFPFVLINSMRCGLECPTGQVGKREFEFGEGVCVDEKQLILRVMLNSTNSTLFDTEGRTAIQAKSTHTSSPGPLPYYQQGLLFNGATDYLTSEEQFSTFLLSANHGAELWIRPAVQTTVGCLLSIHTASDRLLLRLCVTDTASLLLEFSATSLKGPSIASRITLIKGQVTRSRKWTSVGYQLVLLGNRATIATLFIGRFPVGMAQYPGLAFEVNENSMVGRLLVGTSYTSFPDFRDFYTGSIAEISIYNGLMPPANTTCVCPTGLVCSTGGTCLNPCYNTEYQVGSGCSTCDSACSNGCIKGSACKIDTPYVCAEPKLAVGCPKCGDFAEMAPDGVCKCTNNTVLSAAGVCSCIKDYVASEGQCKRCLAYFSPSEVTAVFHSTFLKAVLTFARPVVTKLVSKCDQLLLNSTLEKLGKGYSCVWDRSAKQVTVTFGLAPTLIDEEMALNVDNLYSLQGNCSFEAEPLRPVVGFPGPLPAIAIKLALKPSYSLICAATDSLVVDVSGTVGVKNRPMTFIWTLSSDPVLATLDPYQNHLTSNAKLSIPNTLLDTTNLTISLSVNNTLGSSNSSTASIAITGPSTIGLKVEKGPVVVKNTERLFSLTAKPAVVCAKLGSVKYVWSFLGAVPSSTVSFPQVSLSKLTLSSKSLQVGVVYSFKVEATAGLYTGSSTVSIIVESLSTNKAKSNEAAGPGVAGQEGLIELKVSGRDVVTLEGGNCSSSVLPMGIVLTIAISGLLISTFFCILDRKIVVTENEIVRKSQAEFERRQIEGAKMVLEKSSSMEQIDPIATGPVPEALIRTNASFGRLLLESHCVTGLFVHSSRLYRWMKVAVLTGTLVVEMTAIGLRYAWEEAEEREAEYGSEDFLYCVSGLGVGLGVDLVLLGLFTIAGKLHSRQRKITLAVSLLALLLVTSTAVTSAISLASDLCWESGSRWALNFLPTLAGELLICQTLTGLMRAGLLRLLD